MATDEQQELELIEEVARILPRLGFSASDWPRVSRRLVNPKVAAELLGLQPATLEKWRGERRGPRHFRVSNRAIRYLVGDLVAYLAAHARGSNHQGIRSRRRKTRRR